MKRLLLTAGEPAGIGPDLLAAVAQDDWPGELVAVTSGELLVARARQLGLALSLYRVEPEAAPRPHVRGTLGLIDIPLGAPVRTGVLDPANAAHVLACLGRAADDCRAGAAAALVTAPVQKSVINDAGHAFSGHTEFLAARCGAATPVMLLAAETREGPLRVALATTHLPLRAVADAIDAGSLARVLHVLAAELRAKFGIEQPRLLVCGLNPHAGESGHLGREEIEVIAPVLQRLRAEGLQVEGPLPADTLFTPRVLARGDAVLAMYHDQGLAVLKYAGFGQAVNVTLGLPIVRTSVDHGTALDLAGTGAADPGSLRAAITLAFQLAWRARQP